MASIVVLSVDISVSEGGEMSGWVRVCMVARS